MHWGVLRHFFPGFVGWLKAIRDPRVHPGKCTFPIEYVLMLALLMHCGQCGSRRRLGRELKGGRLSGNVWRMVGRAACTVACHTDTMNGVMEALEPARLEELIAAVFSQLRRGRALDRFRFDGRLTAAIDGAKILSFGAQHCPHCLHQTQDGVTRYFHYVLAAKIVTPCGLVVPLAFEFIENPEGDYDKQDCEIKAWRRLAAKIQALYPRLKLTVVGDGLYAEETTFTVCEQAGWNVIVTLPNDKLPSVTAQLPAELGQWSGSRTQRQQTPETGWRQTTVHWQTPVRYHGEIMHVIEMEELDEEGNRTYYNRWITNVKPSWANAIELAQTGRLRWRIENEGTNTQKNGGYEMEHAYGRNRNAWKNYYLLLQISQLLNDLVRFGDLIQKAARDPTASFAAVFETIKDFAMWLFRCLVERTPDFDSPPLGGSFQIRLARC